MLKVSCHRGRQDPQGALDSKLSTSCKPLTIFNVPVMNSLLRQRKREPKKRLPISATRITRSDCGDDASSIIPIALQSSQSSIPCLSHLPPYLKCLLHDFSTVESLQLKTTILNGELDKFRFISQPGLMDREGNYAQSGLRVPQMGLFLTTT